MKNLNKYLPIIIVIMCAINLVLHWSDSNTSMAWVVALVGWLSVFFERKKNNEA